MRHFIASVPRVLVYGFALPLLLTGTVTFASASPEEGSKTEGHPKSPHGYTHGSPHGKSPHGSGYSGHHGKEEGSGKGYEHGKGYSHGSKGYGHGYKGHHKKGHGKYGHGGGHHGDRDPFSHLLKFAKPLGLTEDQLKTISDKQFEYQKKSVQLHAEHRIAHMELEKLVHSGEFDESAIRNVGERMKTVKAASIQLMIDAKITLLQVLTDEQRKKIGGLHHGG
ncbi:Spy/CpxP family protein refolding chaperone [Nitrospina sp. 32_T5]|uniref:Spy/CpxP family protein refolding chaperone n=1 Tax=unclassified Nitrospina TaxID=2638683 RepID=UPI003F99D0E1